MEVGKCIMLYYTSMMLSYLLFFNRGLVWISVYWLFFELDFLGGGPVTLYTKGMMLSYLFLGFGVYYLF